MRALAWLLRAYIMRFPIARGKGVVLRRLIRSLPIELREFEADVPGGGRVTLRWDEVVGRTLLRDGSFERAELRAMLEHVTTEATVVDIGANVGLVTVPLALAGGRVIAIEPLPENVERLRKNILCNKLTNVVVVEAAAGADDGRAVLHSALDPAFGSLHEVVKYRAAADVEVRLRSLDSLWRELEKPAVKLVKIDVEGAELEVLAGGREVLETCNPVVIVEAGPGGAADAVYELLTGLGYDEATPMEFATESHLFSKR
jgi:FkbM family methyltransferase